MEANQHVDPFVREMQLSVDKADSSPTHLLNTDSNLTFQVIEAILITLRNHTDFEQSLQLLNQLPLSLKALFIDHWHVEEQTVDPPHTLNELIDKMEEDFPELMRDIQYDRQFIKDTFLALTKIISSYAGSAQAELFHGLKINERPDGGLSFLDQDYDPHESSIWLP